MDAVGKAPTRMSTQNVQCLLHVLRLGRFRLQVDVLGQLFLDAIFAKGLAHHVLEFADALKALHDGIALGRNGPVVNQLKQPLVRCNHAVGLYVELVVGPFEMPGQRHQILPQRFAAGKANPLGGMPGYLGCDLTDIHLAVAIEVGIAEMAAQVAFGQADKGRGLADAHAFSLNRVEDLVYLQQLAVVAPNGSVRSARLIWIFSVCSI